jgi:hypothetical protein
LCRVLIEMLMYAMVKSLRTRSASRKRKMRD